MNLDELNMDYVDKLSGRQFELFTGQLMQLLGFKHVKVTRAVGDYGLDVLARTKSGKRIGIQCKHLGRNGDVGYRAVEETVAGMDYYGMDFGLVLTNRRVDNRVFKCSQKRSFRVSYWDRCSLQNLLDIANNLFNQSPKKYFPKVARHRLKLTTHYPELSHFLVIKGLTREEQNIVISMIFFAGRAPDDVMDLSVNKLLKMINNVYCSNHQFIQDLKHIEQDNHFCMYPRRPVRIFTQKHFAIINMNQVDDIMYSINTNIKRGYSKRMFHIFMKLKSIYSKDLFRLCAQYTIHHGNHWTCIFLTSNQLRTILGISKYSNFSLKHWRVKLKIRAMIKELQQYLQYITLVQVRHGVLIKFRV